MFQFGGLKLCLGGQAHQTLHMVTGLPRAPTDEPE